MVLARRFSIVLCLLISSCAVQQRVGNVSSTFIEDVDISNKMKNLPFAHSWVQEGYSIEQFRQVHFKPVRIDTLLSEDWVKSSSPFVSSEQDYLERAREIADYFHMQLSTKTNGYKDKRLEVVSNPSPGTLVVEIALTELELSHPIARAGALALPVPGAGPALSSMSDPHVAFAARVTDGDSEKLIATAADRKFAPTRIIDLNKLTVTSSAREICSIWADSISAALQTGGLVKITDKNFDWSPW